MDEVAALPCGTGRAKRASFRRELHRDFLATGERNISTSGGWDWGSGNITNGGLGSQRAGRKGKKEVFFREDTIRG